jgi:hypothetical protein
VNFCLKMTAKKVVKIHKTTKSLKSA